MTSADQLCPRLRRQTADPECPIESLDHLLERRQLRLEDVNVGDESQSINLGPEMLDRLPSSIRVGQCYEFALAACSLTPSAAWRSKVTAIGDLERV